MLLDENTIQRMWIMRKYLADMNPVEAMEFINDRFIKTKNNGSNFNEFKKTFQLEGFLIISYKEATNLASLDLCLLLYYMNNVLLLTYLPKKLLLGCLFASFFVVRLLNFRIAFLAVLC